MPHRFRAGDNVVVRPWPEILATLDADGTLAGLPFMPEMLDWCGRSFRVERRVEKVCIAAAPPSRGVVRFPAGDVVVLEGPRCGGDAHDGCRRSCKILWKEAWLAPAGAATASPEPPGSGLEELRARLKVKSDGGRYFCQSTELHRATEDFPGHLRARMASVALQELRNGDRTPGEMARLVARWMWAKLVRRLLGDGWLRGPNKQTPTQTLGLRPGERVRVKSRSDIVATLDQRRRNRGLGICYEVTLCCGHESEVRSRVDRIIDERTGLMREMRDTVMLGTMDGRGTLGEECLCSDVLGDCPRGELMFWREIWLERVNTDTR